jgi:flagellar protein FliL
MMGKVVPVVLALVGLGGGVGAGLYLRAPAGATHAAESADHADGAVEADDHASAGDEHGGDETDGLPEFVKMNNQFVVPVVNEGRVSAMVVLSLSLEVQAGNTEAIYTREPKLRDAFLQVLFDHANVGGFSGTFTDGSNLVVLRESLKEAANLVMGGLVTDILITDIARQDS